MIELTCRKCRQVLCIDDGFAGGVCRCQHCGAIQTVPAPPRTRRSTSPAPERPLAPPGPLQGTAVAASAQVQAGPRPSRPTLLAAVLLALALLALLGLWALLR